MSRLQIGLFNISKNIRLNDVFDYFSQLTHAKQNIAKPDTTRDDISIQFVNIVGLVDCVDHQSVNMV